MKKIVPVFVITLGLLLPGCSTLKSTNSSNQSSIEDSFSNITSVSSVESQPSSEDNFIFSEQDISFTNSDNSVIAKIPNYTPTSTSRVTTTSVQEYTVDYAELTNTITTSTLRAVITIDVTCYNTSRFGMVTNYVEYTGSGVIVKEDERGYFAITNNHVIVKEAGYNYAKYSVNDYVGNSHRAQYVASDPNYDLGVIYFEKGSVRLNVIENIRTGQLAEGEPVISLGQPKGQLNSITYGKVNGYPEATELSNAEAYQSNVSFNILEHSAKIASGSSGGPVLDTNLNIVGINYAGSTVDETGFSTVCAAIPGEKVAEYWNSVKSTYSL